MAITKVSSGLISADASSIDLNIDAGTLYLDVSENKVGIGTTSPAQKLDIDSGYLNFSNNYGIRWNGATSVALYGNQTSNFLAFQTSSSEKMRIDSSGNVGIGVSSPFPSARLQVNTGTNLNLAVQTGTTDTSGIKINAFNDAGNANIPLEINGSVMLLKTGEIERLRIISSGNVGIGTSSPSSILHIEGNSNGYTTAPILYFGSTSTVSAEIRDWAIGPADDSYGNFHIFRGTSTGANPIGNDGRVLTISNAGNVGIGTSSPDSILHIEKPSGNNTYLQIKQAGVESWQVGMTASSTALSFLNSGTERMRINSSGNLLVGITSESFSTSTSGCLLRNTGDAYFPIQNSNTLHVYDAPNQAYRFYVNVAGIISATNTSINGLSDERLKENIVDLETGLTEVMALQPRRFDWKNGDAQNVAGFIAQEVESVLPELVGDYKHEELDDCKSLKMGDIVPTLVKAIQEQQTIIDDLKTRIETLENV